MSGYSPNWAFSSCSYLLTLWSLKLYPILLLPASCNVYSLKISNLKKKAFRKEKKNIQFGQWECWRNGSEKHWPLFEGTQVQFPAILLWLITSHNSSFWGSYWPLRLPGSHIVHIHHAVKTRIHLK